MNYYQISQKRAEHNTVIKLKDRTFERRLEGEYNSEIVRSLKKMDEPFKAIIQTSRLSDKLDYKKVSLPFSTEIDCGDIIYWDRVNSNWLIYLKRNTEKNYFLGEMKEANYLIKWKDENGTIYSQLASFTRASSTAMKGADSAVAAAKYLDFLDGEAQMMMPKNEISAKLKRYDKFIVGRNVWEVSGFDDTTYNNIIMFLLREEEYNKDQDNKDLPNGQINIISIVESNLDNIINVKQNDVIELNLVTKVNGFKKDDIYKIEVENCELVDNFISFDTLGTAKVKVHSDIMQSTKEYEINVEEIAVEIPIYTIEGNNSVRTKLPYKYKIIKNINGLTSPAEGTWSIDNNLAEITSINENEVEVSVGKDPGTFTLYCQIDENTREEKIITIKGLFT